VSTSSTARLPVRLVELVKLTLLGLEKPRDVEHDEAVVVRAPSRSSVRHSVRRSDGGDGAGPMMPVTPVGGWRS
jgi:hypothetical protein